MSSTTYWKVDAEASKKIADMYKVRQKLRKQWQEYSASIGASTNELVLSHGWGRLVVCGFLFKEPPAKGFYKSKHGEFWVPRAGTVVRKDMDKMECRLVDDVCNLLGINMFQGDSFITPGIKEKGGSIYIAMPQGKPKKHCTRISDVEYESLFSRKKKAS